MITDTLKDQIIDKLREENEELRAYFQGIIEGYFLNVPGALLYYQNNWRKILNECRGIKNFKLKIVKD